MSPTSDSQEYWEKRISANLNFRGTGHRAFSLENNRWLYQSQTNCMNHLVQRHKIVIKAKSVLDVGCGTGFYVEYFKSREAGSVCGVDITEVSIQFLRKVYPTETFYTADISSKTLPINGPFEIISAIGVLYHILNDENFTQALVNICQMLAPGGYLFITDSFKKPLIPTARHAIMRSLSDYEVVFNSFGIDILEILPVYYFSNQIFIPVIGPLIINWLNLEKWFTIIDDFLRRSGIGNGDGVKLLLAQLRYLTPPLKI